MIKTIQLHGALAKKYTDEPIQIDAKTPFMITRGLCSRFGPEFKQDIRDGFFEFLCTNTETNKTEYVHDELTVTKVVDCDRIDLTPIVEGSGKVGMFIAGVALVVVGVITEQPWMIQMGIGMMIGGVAALLMPVPKIDSLSNEKTDSRPSFLFNGPVNVTEGGGPVPLVYGRFLAGSVVVSAGFSVEQIPYTSPTDLNDWQDRCPRC